MDQASIFSKTAKGVTELGRRDLRLPREHYRLLGLVDGKSNMGQLAGVSGMNAEETEQIFSRLSAEGLVNMLALASEPDWTQTLGGEISVTELGPEESVRAWAEAQRGSRELHNNGFFASMVRPMQGGAKPRILSVEDDPMVARLLDVLLTREGYEVSQSVDGKGAFAALEQDTPDLVLLDVMLPDTTGFDILEWIRKHEKLSRLPAIMVTAQAGEEDVMRGLRAGADGYIFKPFRAGPLLQCIRKVLKI